jgi:hypothetical protein
MAAVLERGEAKSRRARSVKNDKGDKNDKNDGKASAQKTRAVNERSLVIPPRNARTIPYLKQGIIVTIAFVTLYLLTKDRIRELNSGRATEEENCRCSIEFGLRC